MYKIGLLLLVVLFVWVGYNWIDLPLAIYIKNAPLPNWVFSLSKLIDLAFLPEFQLVLWPTLYFLLFRNSCLFIGVSLAVSLAAVDLLKMFFGRARPEVFFSEGIYGFTYFSLSKEFFSFPSAHAAIITALAFAFFYYCFKRGIILALLIGLILSLSRLVLQKHYLSDIVVGTLLSYFICQFVYEKMERKREESFSPRS